MEQGHTLRKSIPPPKGSVNRKDIKDLTKDHLEAWLESQDIRSYRASQILKWIYKNQEDNFESMTDLKRDVRKLLEDNFRIGRLEKIKIETSQDDSRKYLFKLDDGEFVESVLIPERGHYTLCISSQVGCAQKCRFCLTAKSGLVRNLTTGEIISQVRDILHDLNDRDDSQWLKNIVLMGMGEPLANFQNVVNAIGIITDNNNGLGFSDRRFTVSTAGLVPRLFDLNRETSVNLAVSINATNNRTRSMLMPINRKFPLEKLLDACRKYNLPSSRRITFEYVLIKGINDSVEDAKRLTKLLRSIRSKINLIPFNSHAGCDFCRPEEPVINKFKEIIYRENYTVTIRRSKGQDISAACGQLSANIGWKKTIQPTHKLI